MIEERLRFFENGCGTRRRPLRYLAARRWNAPELLVIGRAGCPEHCSCRLLPRCAPLARLVESGAKAADDQATYRRRIAESDFRLSGMHVHIHFLERHRKEQSCDRVTIPRNEVAVSTPQRTDEQAILHRSGVDEQELLVGQAPVERRQADDAGQSNAVALAVDADAVPVKLRAQQLSHTLRRGRGLKREDPAAVMDRILRELKLGHGFQAVQVAENVSFEQYAAITVRLPDLPGVQATRGFSRYYPSGPAVAHLVGYVGTANEKEYEAEDKNPLLIIPGVKIGKQGLEKSLEKYLRGVPGGQRVEVTARGKLVQELDPKPDRSGQTVQLTIDQGLQEYAARRMGDQSGALVAMDVANGDLLAFVSMPAFDPNSFSEGIGRTEWKMLSENDHIPLLNKVAQGLYPSGSTIKPAMALAFLKQGIDPKRRVHCAGGYQIGNRYFRCDAVHGSMDMHSAIERSCNTYFWATGLVTDPAQTTEMVNYLGYGQEFDLPIPSQRFGTMPNPKWLEKKYHRKWQGYDSANTSIGQGYVLVNPLQLAVMWLIYIPPHLPASATKAMSSSVSANAAGG